MSNELFRGKRVDNGTSVEGYYKRWHAMDEGGKIYHCIRPENSKSTYGPYYEVIPETVTRVEKEK